MMDTVQRGRARRFGDDVNTDYIISSTRKRESLDPQVLRHFLFEGIDPAFAASVQPGDVIVAGKNFGCGSAMEIAVTAVLGAGIPMVIAASFSRIYFRNAVNNGLVPVICDTRAIAEGDRYARAWRLRGLIEADGMAISGMRAEPPADAEGPLDPCPDCGAGRRWRLSVLSGGPGPWRCQPCAPPRSGGLDRRVRCGIGRRRPRELSFRGHGR
jgi:3-isopropylmalate dehydratase small subunit